MEAWLETEIYVERDTVITAMVGFESPARSNRISDGIGKQGRWETEGQLFVNGIEIFPSFDWQEPEKYRYHFNTWGHPGGEIPYTDEQLFWTRTPSRIPLKSGWNKIRLHSSRLFNINNWVAAFIPVSIDQNGKLSEAKGLRMR